MRHGFAPVEETAAMGITDAAFRALADAQEDCVFLTDRKGCYIAANASFARWLGRPASAILGRTAFDVWPLLFAEEEVRDDRRALGGEPVEREDRRPCGAQMRTVRLTRTPVRDEEGVVLGVLGTFRDVTHADAPDPARRLAVPMELVGRLAGGVAHDFSNLLTVILGHLALLREVVAPEGPHVELLDAAERASNQAAGLSQQLLAFLRNEPRAPEPVDLNAAVEQVAGLLRRTMDARIHLQTHLQPYLPRVEAVSAQLTQLLLNLCLNGRDAMPHGGRLWVETSAEAFDADGARRHPLRRPGSFVRLRVADNGEGMPPAVRARLFEPAFTTKGAGQGTGLGLAVVQSVVAAHRGWIECVSTVGQGTCFDVYLPLLQER